MKLRKGNIGANFQMLHTVYHLHLYNILKVIKLNKWRMDYWLLGIKDEWVKEMQEARGMAVKDSRRDLCGTVLFCILTISKSMFLLSQSCSSFATCYHWGKLGKWHTEFLCIVSYNCMWIYNYLKIINLT